MAHLKTLGSQTSLAPVLDILSTNPGMPFDKAKWPYVGFKGGSEPGVLSLAWLLRRSDNRWFVLSLTLNDSTTATDQTNAAVGVAQGALSLLATAP